VCLPIRCSGRLISPHNEHYIKPLREYDPDGMTLQGLQNVPLESHFPDNVLGAFHMKAELKRN
jgi:hypothetical protein